MDQDAWDYDFNPERIRIFTKFRMLIMQKDKEGDQIAVDVLAWALEELSKD